MFLNCPAYLDHEGAVRCGLPAEVRCRFTMRSTDGPVESAMIRCPAGHCFGGAIESLTWDGKDKHDPGTAAAASPAGRDSLQRGHDDRRGGGGSALRDFPAKPGRNAARQHRSRVLPGPPCRPVAHRHAPAPQAHRLRLPAGSRRQQRSPHPGLRRAPAQLTPQSSVRVNRRTDRQETTLRILFAAMPFDRHFLPMTRLAQRLRREGHDVRFYAGWRRDLRPCPSCWWPGGSRPGRIARDRPDTSRTPGQSRLTPAGIGKLVGPRPSPKTPADAPRRSHRAKESKRKAMTTMPLTATRAAPLPTTPIAILALLGRRVRAVSGHLRLGEPGDGPVPVASGLDSLHGTAAARAVRLLHDQQERRPRHDLARVAVVLHRLAARPMRDRHLGGAAARGRGADAFPHHPCPRDRGSGGRDPARAGRHRRVPHAVTA